MANSFPVSEANAYSAASRKRATKMIHRTINVSDTTVWDMQGFQSFTCHINNNGASNNDILTFECSADGTSWAGLRVRLLAGSYDAGASFPDYVPLTFRLGNQNQGFVFGANAYNRYVRLRYTNVTPNTLDCNVYLSENNIPPIETNFGNSLEAQTFYSSTSAITTTTDVQFAAPASPAFRQALIRIDVKNSGASGGFFTIHELPTKVVFRTEYIGPGERISLDLSKTPIKTTAGSKGLNFALIDITGMSVTINTVTINLLAQ